MPCFGATDESRSRPQGHTSRPASASWWNASIRLRANPTFTLPPGFHEALVTIYPPMKPVKWPPKLWLDDKGMLEMAQAWCPRR
jgi:hypothetical protein